MCQRTSDERTVSIFYSERYGMPGICLIFAGIFVHGFALSFLWKQPNATGSAMSPSHEDWQETVTHEDAKTQSDKTILDYDIKMEYIGDGKRQVKTIQDNDKDNAKGFDNEAFKHDILSTDLQQPNQSTYPNEHVSNGITIQTVKQAKQSSNKKTPSGAEQKKTSVLESLKFLTRQKLFWTYALGMSVMQAGMTQLPIFVVDIFFDKGFSGSDASLCLFMYNVFSGVGRVLPGIALRFPNLSPVSTLIVAPLIGVVGLLGVLYTMDIHMALLFVSVFGIGHGISTASFSVTTMRLFGVEHMSNAIGLLFTSCSLGAGTIGPLCGTVFDLVRFLSSRHIIRPKCWFTSNVILNHHWSLFFNTTKVTRRIYVRLSYNSTKLTHYY